MEGGKFRFLLLLLPLPKNHKKTQSPLLFGALWTTVLKPIGNSVCDIRKGAGVFIQEVLPRISFLYKLQLQFIPNLLTVREAALGR